MKYPVLLTLPALFLSACSSLGGPSADDIARLPIVSFGQTVPDNSEFVLHYPAGVDIPVTAKVTGNLLTKTDQATLKVRIKQDIYLYRDRISFDGKTWASGNDKVSGKFWFSLPGAHENKIVNAHNPGEIGAEFNLR